MPNAFIICIRLKEVDKVDKHYSDAYRALKQGAVPLGLTISETFKLKQGEFPLPQGIFKATGTDSIDKVNALANSAAGSVRCDFVIVFEITDSEECIRAVISCLAVIKACRATPRAPGR
jgi:hypothetical protein